MTRTSGPPGRADSPDEEPKSAYEIAMERLRRRDREEGHEAPAPLTGEQRERIAGIRREAEAKIAQLEIMHRSHLGKAGGDPEAIERVEESYRLDRRKIDEEREGRIERVRSGGGS